MSRPGFWPNRPSRAIRVPFVAFALSLFLWPGHAVASETVSNRFDLFVPVSLSVLEIAVRVLPTPLAVCALVHDDAVMQTLKGAVR